MKRKEKKKEEGNKLGIVIFLSKVTFQLDIISLWEMEIKFNFVPTKIKKI